MPMLQLLHRLATWMMYPCMDSLDLKFQISSNRNQGIFVHSVEMSSHMTAFVSIQTLRCFWNKKLINILIQLRCNTSNDVKGLQSVLYTNFLSGNVY